MCCDSKRQSRETQRFNILPQTSEKDLEKAGFIPIENRISMDSVTLELVEGALKTEKEKGYRFILQKKYLGTIFSGQHNSGIELEIIIFEAYRKDGKKNQIKFFNSKKLFVKKDDPNKKSKIRLAQGLCLLSAFFEARHIRCRETEKSFVPIKQKKSRLATTRKLFSTFLKFLSYLKRSVTYFLSK